MENEQGLTSNAPDQAQSQDQGQRDLPGDEEGRIDVTGKSGVYPVSSMEGASDEAEIRPEMSWGQGERGAAGYYDSGESELTDFVKQEENFGGVAGAPEAAPQGDVAEQAPPSGP